MDVHPPKNGIFIGIDPYPYIYHYISIYSIVWSCKFVIPHVCESVILAPNSKWLPWEPVQLLTTAKYPHIPYIHQKMVSPGLRDSGVEESWILVENSVDLAGSFFVSSWVKNRYVSCRYCCTLYRSKTGNDKRATVVTSTMDFAWNPKNPVEFEVSKVVAIIRGIPNSRRAIQVTQISSNGGLMIFRQRFDEKFSFPGTLTAWIYHKHYEMSCWTWGFFCSHFIAFS